jgi:hypothetical protein
MKITKFWTIQMAGSGLDAKIFFKNGKYEVLVEQVYKGEMLLSAKTLYCDTIEEAREALRKDGQV